MKKLFYSLLACLSFQCLHAQNTPNTYRRVIYTDATIYRVFEWPDRSLQHVGSSMSGVGIFLHTDSVENVLNYTSFNVNNPLTSPQVNYFDALPVGDSLFLAVGRVLDTATGELQGLIVKSDRQSQIFWSKGLHLAGYHTAFYCCDLTPDSGLYVGGERLSSSSGLLSEVLVAKYDSTGNLLWSYVFSGGNNNNFCHDIKTTSDGGCVVTGYYENYPPFSSSAFLIKLDANGNLQWSKKYSEPGTGIFTSGSEINILGDGYLIYVISGFQNFLIRTDQNGSILWTKAITTYSSNVINFKGNRMVKTTAGNYLLTSGDDFMSHMICVDTAGNPLWASSMMLRLYDVFETSNKEFHVTGGGPIFGVLPPPPDPLKNTGMFIDNEIGALQTDSNGVLTTYCYYNDNVSSNPITVNEQSYTPVITSSGINQSVTIYSSSLADVAIDTCVSVFGSVNELNGAVELTLYPNPANEYCRFELPVNSSYSITVFDINGSKVEEKTFSGNQYDLNLKLLVNGFYYCILSDKSGKLYRGRIGVMH